MSASRPRTRRLRTARWLLATAIFGSTMAIGAVHLPVLVLVSLVVLAAMVLAWWGTEPFRARRSASLVLWTAVGLTGWTAVSRIPLPASLLARLAPHNADVWARCLGPLALPGPAWATLSLDPGATSGQVLRGVVYALVFLTATRLAARREGVVFLEAALVVSGLALAAAAVIHPALGAEKVFGFYVPRNDPGARHIAPILNANVLSGYLNIALALILGQVLSPRSPWPRSLLAALAVALIGIQVWVASRGGVLGTVVAVVVVTWSSRSKAPERRGGARSFLVPGLLVFAGVGMMVVASSEEAMGELAQADVSKLDIAREALRVVPHFPVFGIGRGAFESVFPAFRSDTTHLVYAHPENVVAQWLTEWGAIAGSVAFVTLLVALRPASALTRSPRAAGAWGALVAVGVQQLVDFGSEYPAVVLALTTCAAIVTGGTSGLGEPRPLEAWATRPWVLVVAGSLATAGAIVLALPGAGHEVYDDRLALRASALDATVGRTEFEHRAEAAMLRHPAEPFLPFAGALRAVRARDATPLPWIERTLERAIVYGPAHLLLARWLYVRSPSQARLEYRLALEQAPELGQYVAAELGPLVHDYDDATELIPKGPGRADWVGALSTSLASKLPATSRRLDDLLLQLAPNDVVLAERRARQALADLLAGAEAPWCTGERHEACARLALERSARLIELAPTQCTGYSLHARAVLENGNPAQALKELKTGAASVSDRIACFEALADLAGLAQSDATVTLALERISHAGCTEPAECVHNLEFVAGREESRGNPRSALALLERAREKAPDNDALVEQVAGLASRLDLHAESVRAYQSLAQRHPSDGRWAAAIAAERAALLTAPVAP